MVRNKQEIAVGEPYIVANDLSLHNPIRSAYMGVSCTIPKGKLCSIVGENGSGKTEFLLTIAGRMKQTSGTLTVAGYSHPEERSMIRPLSGLGFFARVNEVQPVLRVRSVFAAELNLYSIRSSRKATEALLDKWGLLKVADSRVDTLDRYTYVRLGIALGLVGSPELLVVDDIEADLTRHQSIKLLNELAEIAHSTDTTIVVSVTDYELGRLADLAIPINAAAQAQAQAVEEKYKKGQMHQDEIRNVVRDVIRDEVLNNA
ncbi:MAG: ATP-binding cassette domain-containing protein [Coriobacteriales bacterium]|nr:ATP-binding cassette domain-containing protein [Coriobacteriales bacterium]